MHIAQVAPLIESVPPKQYGGTERVVSYLTEELAKRGHQVTLYASGDSITQAKLVSLYPQALRKLLITEGITQGELHTARGIESFQQQAAQVIKDADQFDVIHSHIDLHLYPLCGSCKTPILHTQHGRIDIPELDPIFAKYQNLNYISISNSQRKPHPKLNWVNTVYHGIPIQDYDFNPNKGQYLAFLGRLSPEKRPDWAIEIAKKSQMPLKIAAKIDPTDQEYYETTIKPLIDNRFVEFIGEINEKEKSEFLGNALALLSPIDWPEPFGLVNIEALACGTPVIARPCGALPEILTSNKVGFLGNSIEELSNAVKLCQSINRVDCRQFAEQHFSVEKMADNYLDCYTQLTNQLAIAV